MALALDPGIFNHWSGGGGANRPLESKHFDSANHTKAVSNTGTHKYLRAAHLSSCSASGSLMTAASALPMTAPSQRIRHPGWGQSLADALDVPARIYPPGSQLHRLQAPQLSARGSAPSRPLAASAVGQLDNAAVTLRPDDALAIAAASDAATSSRNKERRESRARHEAQLAVNQHLLSSRKTAANRIGSFYYEQPRAPRSARS
eukprot:TRINITY_DN39626_c0_g1_i1.p1 TRINITY_DN39626_c0_g1~~TRINITY_DN39626_c0_g1_i1.p1  ORF type:complete len:204 (-),score=23.19 TRINITY_DN39626_c0_g1_i1:175-786(-)